LKVVYATKYNYKGKYTFKKSVPKNLQMNRIEKLKEFLQTGGDDAFLKHALALEYIKIGDDVTARSLFEQILEKDPGYTGSYYHLAKLLERMNKKEEAIQVYETGMQECSKANDNHAYNELRSALEDLE
jgi:Tfp pilus assembly protein PilF